MEKVLAIEVDTYFVELTHVWLYFSLCILCVADGLHLNTIYLMYITKLNLNCIQKKT